MRLRATPLNLLGVAALVALLAANVASACDSAHAKFASAANMKCGHACSMSACSMSNAASAVVAKPAPVPVGAFALPGMPSLVSQPAQTFTLGLMAFLDPETGLVGGSAGDFQLAVDPAQTLTPQPVFTQMTTANGAVMIDLQGAMQDYMILSLDALGRRSFHCSTDPRQALKSQAPVTTPPASTPSER
jgi:hypothetical protein